MQPVIAVFEDLHWNDSLTIGLLNELVISMPDARLMLVVTYRPEHRDEWMSRPNYRQLRLEPLATDDLAELLRVLLGTDTSVQKLNRFLWERADGNPFFIEEMVRSLIDAGVVRGARGQYVLAKPISSIEVPTTVQGVLGARIDALPQAEKRVLQEAAVIGHDAPFALLHAISGLSEDEARGLLGNLQAADFLFTTQLFPDLRFTFKHALTHDVAYGGLLHERRREVHARIVHAIEALYADRLSEHVEALAAHALQGHLWEKQSAICGRPEPRPLTGWPTKKQLCCSNRPWKHFHIYRRTATGWSRRLMCISTYGTFFSPLAIACALRTTFAKPSCWRAVSAMPVGWVGSSRTSRNTSGCSDAMKRQ